MNKKKQISKYSSTEIIHYKQNQFNGIITKNNVLIFLTDRNIKTKKFPELFRKINSILNKKTF